MADDRHRGRGVPARSGEQGGHRAEDSVEGELRAFLGTESGQLRDTEPDTPAHEPEPSDSGAWQSLPGLPPETLMPAPASVPPLPPDPQPRPEPLPADALSPLPSVPPLPLEALSPIPPSRPPEPGRRPGPASDPGSWGPPLVVGQPLPGPQGRAPAQRPEHRPASAAPAPHPQAPPSGAASALHPPAPPSPVTPALHPPALQPAGPLRPSNPAAPGTLVIGGAGPHTQFQIEQPGQPAVPVKRASDVPPPLAQDPPEDPVPPGKVRCPQCHALQAQGGHTCLYCGVIFARFKGSAGGAARAAIAGSVTLARAPVLGEAAAAVPLGFWASLGTAFTMPLAGWGALYLPLMGVLLLVAGISGGRLGLFLKLSVVGMVAGYFGKCVARGIDADTRAPQLAWPSNIQAEWVYPGLAVIGLTLLLWGPPAFLVGQGLYSGARSAAAQLEDSEGRMEGFLPWETFRDVKGSIVTLKESDPPTVVQRADRSWVKVYPEEGYLIRMPPDWRPGFSADVPDPLAEKDGDSELATLWKKAGPRGTRLLALLGLIFFAFYYWPMALTAGAVGTTLLNIFNPIVVLPSAIRVGVEYLVVVVIGMVLLIAPLFVLWQLSFVLLAPLLLVLLAYTCGVQGYLMGRLVAEHPKAFPDLRV